MPEFSEVINPLPHSNSSCQQIEVSIQEIKSQEKLEIAKTVIVKKLEERIRKHKPPFIVTSDLDGTLYQKIRDSNGKWKKEGNNKNLQKQLDQKIIPLIIVSGRPDWENGDEEMKDYGLKPPHIVITGAGTIIYWRTKEGNLVLNQEFIEKMKNQSVTIINENNTSQTFTYGKGVNNLRGFLDTILLDFKNKGLDQVKIDTNQSTGFVTLDISDMSWQDLRNLVNTIKSKVKGVRVSFSENLEKVSELNFSGWVQIILASGSKNKALRYVLEKVAKVINPSNKGVKKPHALCFGDAAIDIWLLAFGISYQDIYTTTQYFPEEKFSYTAGYLTPYAQEKLKKVFQALRKASPLPYFMLHKVRRTNLKMLPEGLGYPEALEKVLSTLD